MSKKKYNEEYTEYLNIAVCHENIDKVKQFLRGGGDPNYFDDENDYYLLEVAINTGNKEIIKLLLENEAIIGFRDVRLSISKYKDTEILELLYNYRPDLINLRDEDFGNVLNFSVIVDKLEALKFLISKGGDKNSYEFLQYSTRSWRLLDLAYKYRHFNIVKYLKSIEAESFFKWHLIKDFESKSKVVQDELSNIIFEYSKIANLPFYKFLKDKYDFRDEEIDEYFITEKEVENE